MKPTGAEKTFVKLVTASGMTEADVWKALLESAGIQVYLRNETMGTLLGVSGDLLGAVDLWVPKDDAARALEILQDEPLQTEVDEEA